MSAYCPIRVPSGEEMVESPAPPFDGNVFAGPGWLGTPLERRRCHQMVQPSPGSVLCRDRVRSAACAAIGIAEDACLVY